MADTAVSAGEIPGQRREHLPRQQPLRPTPPGAPATGSGGGPVLGTAQLLLAADNRPNVRPLSVGAGYEQANMGPHPGTAMPARVNSIGGAGRTADNHDQSSSPQGQIRHPAKASYLQQRASGTMHEHVFNGHDASAAAAAAAPSVATKHSALVPGAGREAHYGEGAQHTALPSGQAYRSSRRMVGPYQLAKTIGAGSMGKVKVALDTRTNKR
ncbi:hypothetical protein GGF43_004266, partial [Coemansia sp. RSA 2618]